MESKIKNQDFKSKLLQNLTKYASKPLGFDKIYIEQQNIKKRGKYRNYFIIKNLDLVGKLFYCQKFI